MSTTPRRIVPRLLTAAATVALIAGTSLTIANAASASTTPAAPAGPTSMSRPAIAGPGDAPLGGVVPGRTGSAITASEKAQAIHRERTLALTKGTNLAAVEHPAAGVYFSGLSTSTGIRANHSVFYGTGDHTIPSDVLYAPTVMPPSNACIEITTAYTSGSPVVWAWDWCASGDSGVAKEITIDASFVSTYTTPVNGVPAYSVEISKTNSGNNTWTAYLYNFAKSTWDTFWSRSGTSQIGNDGWDVFEPYVTRNPSTGVGYYCTSMSGRTIEASTIQVKVNDTWTNASSSNNAQRYSLDLTCGSHLTWTQPALDGWRAVLN